MSINIFINRYLSKSDSESAIRPPQYILIHKVMSSFVIRHSLQLHNVLNYRS